MNSKFEKLYEAAMDRYQRAGFLVGDRVQFVDGFKSKESYKALGTNTQELIGKMIESGLNIRVSNITNASPSYFPANPEYSSGDKSILDVALDSGGGRYTLRAAVPADLVEKLDDEQNLPPIPDEQKRKDPITIKPEEMEEDSEHITRNTDRGDAKLSKTELDLPTKNTKLPSTPAKGTNDPVINTYMKALANK
jgi:hypothetical protein